MSENLVKPRLNLVGKEQVEVDNILNEALYEFEQRKPGYTLLIRSLLLKLLVLVGRAFTEDLENSETRSIYDRHRGAILGAIQYITEHYYEELCVEEIEKKFMLSQSYFSYLFKSITSKKFIEYLNGIRIAKALELLRKTDKRVLDISYEVGFNNINYFNRMFKQQMGTSPLAYRRRPLGDNQSNLN